MTFLIPATVFVAALLFMMLPRTQPLFVQRESWVATGLFAALFIGTQFSFGQVHTNTLPDVSRWFAWIVSFVCIAAAGFVLTSKRPFDAAFATVVCAVGTSIQIAIGGSLGFALITSAFVAVTVGILLFVQIPVLEIKPGLELCREPIISAIACAALIVVALSVIHSDPGWTVIAMSEDAASGVIQDNGPISQMEERQSRFTINDLAHLAIPIFGLGLFGIMTRTVSIFKLFSIQILTLGVLSLTVSYSIENGWPMALPISCFLLVVSTAYSFVLSQNSTDWETTPLKPGLGVETSRQIGIRQTIDLRFDSRQEAEVPS